MGMDIGREPGKWSGAAVCSAWFAVFDRPCSASQAPGPQVCQEVPELGRPHLRERGHRLDLKIIVQAQEGQRSTPLLSCIYFSAVFSATWGLRGLWGNPSQRTGVRRINKQQRPLGWCGRAGRVSGATDTTESLAEEMLGLWLMDAVCIWASNQKSRSSPWGM